MEELRDDIIICGYGRVGRRVAAEFQATGTPYVVVDVTPESMERARADGAPVVLGDGTEDTDLRRAGIERARGLVASVDSDEKNLYITLTARTQRPDLVIVARASTDAAARKIRLTGADRVIQPYSTAGLHMANFVVKPQVADFLDIVSTAGESMPDLHFEEIIVRADCAPCGRSIGQLRVQETTGALVIALRKADGTFDATPGSDRDLRGGRRAHRRRVVRRDREAGEALRSARGAGCLIRSGGWRALSRTSPGHRSSSSGRAIPSTATTRPTSRSGSRRAEERAPREIADGDRSRGGAEGDRRRGRDSGARLRESACVRRVACGGSGGDSRCRRGVRRRIGGESRAAPGRDGLRQPDRPAYRRPCPKRRLWRLGRPAARVRGTPGRARVLLQRRRGPDGALSRLRGGGTPRGATARGRLPGASTSPSSRSSRVTRSRRCSSASRLRSSGSASTSTRGSARASSERRSTTPCPCSTPTRPRGRCGRARAPTATTRTGCSFARTASRRTSPRTPPTSGESSPKASTGWSTSWAPTTTGTSHVCRHSPRCSATRGTR